MLGIANNSLSGIVHRGPLRSRAMLLALLGALIFAATAHAEAPIPAGTADVPAALETPSGGVGAAGEGQGTTPSEGPEGGSVADEAPQGAPETPAEAVTPTEPPPTDPVVPVETVPPTDPVVPVETPVLPVEAVVPTEPAPVIPMAAEEKTETAAPLAGAEETGKGAGTLVEASAQAGDTHSASVVAAAEASTVPALTPSGVSEVSIHSAAEQAGSAAEIVSLGVAVRKTASRLGGQLSCELSALAGRSPGSCGAGLLGVQRLLLGSGTTLSGVSISLDPSANGVVPERGSHGSSTAVGGAPAGPAPGSSTGGSSGAAVGASGPAPSAFLSLACLLLLGAPRALRRLRLSSRPLLTASFVLIPERPG
jgi:hypothetical protein